MVQRVKMVDQLSYAQAQVGHVNDCMGQRGDGQAVMDLCRSREDREKI